ncbi:BTAD domain-containing putative transcriptional regulator [Streptomyces sp. NPDC001904]|uniref:BTAD domain-containing putative transcriptional regulator n=1 Tax=Streptomyces sp. NPDC001904 TaxID=3154531 RepID=UPI0033348C48
MTRPPLRPSPPRSTGVRLLRAVAAVLALGLLVVGLPLLLTAATQAVWSSGIDAFTHLLSRSDTLAGGVLVLCLVGWAGWATFLISLLREIPAQLRGRTARALPGMRLSQRAAAMLVGSIIVLLPTGSALAATPASATTPTSVSSVQAVTPHQEPAGSHARGSSAEHQRAQGEQQDLYTVRDTRPAESLWSIAERLYGKGELYTHIAQANEGKTMVDGTVFHADATIRPGWVLSLPAGVPHSAAAAQTGGLSPQFVARTDTSAQTHTVVSGESLSAIAQDETGSAANWPDLYEASRGEQPGGLPRITDPDQILPGQRVTVPAGEASADRDPGAGKQHDDSQREDKGEGGQERDSASPPHDDGARSGGQDDAGSGSHHADGDEDSEASAPPAGQAPGAKESSESTQGTGGQTSQAPSAGATTTSPPAADSPLVPDQSTTPPLHRPAGDAAAGDTTSESPAASVSVQTGAGVLALLAAALTGTLAVRRMRQRRRRKPGQTLPATATAPQEATLEQTAGDGGDGVQRLHAALAALAANAPASPPPLRGARITPAGVDVLPGDVTAVLQRPFTEARAGWWHLPDSQPLPETSAPGMPYPALVTLGADPAQNLVMAHLPSLPVLLVDGTPEERAEVIACLATELAIGPSADHVEVIACGLGAMGADVSAFGVQYLPDPRLAASEFASRVLEAHQEPDDAAMPYVVMCAGELDDDTAWRFAETLDKARGLVTAALILPATAVSVFPEAESVDATLQEPQRVEQLGCDVALQRLDAGSAAALAAAYRQTSEAPVQAEGVWEHVPPEAIALPDRAPAVQAVPTGTAAGPADDGISGDTDTTAEQVSPPVVASSALDSPGGPGDVPFLALHSNPDADSDRADDAAGKAEKGPRFIVPSAYAILAPERPAPVPETDADRALAEAGDNTTPRLRVLGRIEMEGVDLEPRLTELTAHLVLRPGSSADVICEDLGDSEPWSAPTLNARLRGLRNKLGLDSNGKPYVPQRKVKSSPYTVSDQLRCDWTQFERLAELGLSRGAEGLHYLERALTLVQGAPLGEHPATWMVPLRTYMQNRITDVAHTVATHRLDEGPHQDFPSARKACAVGLDADPLAEIVHRTLMKVEAQAGNRSGLRAAVTRWQATTRHLDRERIDPVTQCLVDELLAAS